MSKQNITLSVCLDYGDIMTTTGKLVLNVSLFISEIDLPFCIYICVCLRFSVCTLQTVRSQRYNHNATQRHVNAV